MKILADFGSRCRFRRKRASRVFVSAKAALSTEDAFPSQTALAVVLLLQTDVVTLFSSHRHIAADKVSLPLTLSFLPLAREKATR
jgi:hypothetical protein